MGYRSFVYGVSGFEAVFDFSDRVPSMKSLLSGSLECQPNWASDIID